MAIREHDLCTFLLDNVIEYRNKEWGDSNCGGVCSTIGSYLLTNAASQMRSNAIAYGYTGNAYASYKIKRYDSVNSISVDRYSKLVGTYYGKAGYKGNSTPHTFYSHNYFS